MSISREQIRRVRELCKATNDGCGNWSQDGVRAFFEVIPDPDLILALCDAAERGAEVTVTDELANHVMRIYDHDYYRFGAFELECHGRRMRAALEAALTHRPTPEEAGK